MSEFPSKNKKRAQRRYRDRKAQQRRADKFKYRKVYDPENFFQELESIHNTERLNAKLPELPKVVEMDDGQTQGLGDLHIGRDQDTPGRQVRETLGSTPDVGPGADLEATA